jgi:hypothetical protein
MTFVIKLNRVHGIERASEVPVEQHFVSVNMRLHEKKTHIGTPQRQAVLLERKNLVLHFRFISKYPRRLAAVIESIRKYLASN